MRTKFLKHVNFILLMLVTGVFWGTWFTMTRSIDNFSQAEFKHIGQVIIDNVATPMKFLMPLTIILLIANSWIEYRKQSRSFYPIFGALALMIATLMITLLVEVPIDNQIKTWTSMTVPDEWMAMRQKWAWYHGFRTMTAIGSFILFSIGVVVLGRFGTNKFSYSRHCRRDDTGKWEESGDLVS